ncbi:hypothetical protein PsorP6_000726 [Peronosclerospora sorghi]|uniref:Uncharacterized protein n=1 Tax=Peronosclerospora sorghi TaxID=230839 RepID=A0ACC0WYN2_9STRA|nr:hypothetical protein PsorP6_000726 [Peronosclerospora sorghi]
MHAVSSTYRSEISEDFHQRKYNMNKRVSANQKHGRDVSFMNPTFSSTGYCETGEYYAVADLTETQRLLLGKFIDFGLLYRKLSNSDRFYTTSLAVNLIFGGSMGQKRSHVRLTSSFASAAVKQTARLSSTRHESGWTLRQCACQPKTSGISKAPGTESARTEEEDRDSRNMSTQTIYFPK